YNGPLTMWSLATGKTRVLSENRGYYHLIFSPNGKYLVVSKDNKLEVWDTSTGEKRVSFPGYYYYNTVVLFSPDGQTLILPGPNYGSSKVWDLARNKERVTFRDFQHGQETLRFSPDGRTLAAWQNDSTIRLWDTTTGQALPTLRDAQLPPNTWTQLTAMSF